MHLDVQDLRNFYYRTALGRSVKRIIGVQVLEMWPETKGQTVVGFGFAVPFLRPYLKQARRVTALMPGPQGVMPWPSNAPNLSVLCQETLWPLETGHVDRLMVSAGGSWGQAVKPCSSCRIELDCGRAVIKHRLGSADPTAMVN